MGYEIGALWDVWIWSIRYYGEETPTPGWNVSADPACHVERVQFPFGDRDVSKELGHERMKTILEISQRQGKAFYSFIS